MKTFIELLNEAIVRKGGNAKHTKMESYLNEWKI